MRLVFRIFGLLMTCIALSCGHPVSRSTNTKSETQYAKYLNIKSDSAYTIVSIVNPQDTAIVLGTFLFAANDSVIPPADFPDAVVLYPHDLKNLMVYSSVHAAALKELGALEAIKEVGDAQYFTIPEIREGLAEGRITDVGTQQEPITERILKTCPGVILISYYNGVDLSALQRLGIPIIPLAESCEATPLGRAEWIKLMGLIAGNHTAADSIFNATSSNYANLKKLVADVAQRPTVLTETMYQGVWAISGGQSYAARMIADAGGDYLWKDDTHEGSIELPFESVLARGKDADIWLIRSFDSDISSKYLKGLDERYMLFAPARDMKGLWGANTSVVNFYEETPFHPDRLLKDYIGIFHPRLLPEYTPRYFKEAKQ